MGYASFIIRACYLGLGYSAPRSFSSRLNPYFYSLYELFLLSMNDPRYIQMQNWLSTLPKAHQIDPESARSASADASFRRYFRVQAGDQTHIVMDAPAPQEDTRPFIAVSHALSATGVTVPYVFEADTTQGYLLLGDLGNTTYLDVLANDTAQALYGDAINALITFQSKGDISGLPQYDSVLLRRELNLYPDWYIARHKNMVLAPKQLAALHTTFDAILANNLAQPKVFVHRDYHSRNLMLLRAGNPGILDFQDAVCGPITYDLVSLLRDAYIRWEEEQVIDWVVRYWEQARKAGLPVATDFSVFYRDFEWMGLQRHLKVLGIFARLNYRDGKSRYLDDMPLVLSYVTRVCERYNDLAPLHHLIKQVEQTQSSTGLTF